MKTNSFAFLDAVKKEKNSQECIDIDQVVWASKLNLSFQNVQQNVNKRRTLYQTSQQGDLNIRVQRALCWYRHHHSGIQLPNRYVRTLSPGRIDDLPRAGTFRGGCKILKNNLPAEASARCRPQSRKKAYNANWVGKVDQSGPNLTALKPGPICERWNEGQRSMKRTNIRIKFIPRFFISAHIK